MTDEMSAAIDAAVASAVRGEDSLYNLIWQLVYGTRPKPDSRDWPADAQAIWREAVSRWTPLYRASRRTAVASVTLADVWEAVEAIAGPSRPGSGWWQNLAQLRWPLVAGRLRLGDRTAIYQIVQKQRWQFKGKGKNRRCTAAPCVRCEKVVSPEQIIYRHCPSCHEEKS